jgi:hypothetical protein
MSDTAPEAVTGVPKWKRNDLVQPGDVLGAGDSFLSLDVLPSQLASVAFDNLRNEVQWKTMHHHGGEVPRLVAVQGEIQEDGWYATALIVYRINLTVFTGSLYIVIQAISRLPF